MMATNLFVSESKFIERSRSALANVQTNEVIKQAMAEYGMGAPEISAGLQILNNAIQHWEDNKQEVAETTIASRGYKGSYNILEAIFKEHRDKTLIFFKKQPDILVSVGVSGSFPSSYTAFFDKVKLFYGNIKKNPALQAEFDKIKITADVVDSCYAKYEQLLADRANYDKEAGESQAATKSKNAALLELKNWMEDFDATAKVALYNQPQLLEVLGIFVRS